MIPPDGPEPPGPDPTPGAATSPAAVPAPTEPAAAPVLGGTPPAPPRSGTRRAVALGVALLVALGAGIGIGAATASSSSGSSTSPTSTTPPSNAGTAAHRGEPTAAEIAASVNPAVVDINTTLANGGGEAAGTGMVISPSGRVLTNNHVINEATTISVRLVSSGRTYSASVVGYDVTNDIAVLQLDGASGLPTINTAKGPPVLIGQPVVAVGNALGHGGTPASTPGTVSGTGQTVTASEEGQNTETLHGMIQTDAHIQPGDSGGPLVNPDGQVVGMDTAATANSGSTQQSSAEAGFAIPITNALNVARQIEASQSGGSVHLGTRGILGVEIAVQSPRGGQGASVLAVEPHSPAAGAGIVSGDSIVTVNGTPVAGATDLSSTLAKFRPGDKVTIGWVDRSGKKHTAVIALAAGPPS